MTYPLDDNGNVRVDFVWGNFPLQPDEQRTGQQQDWVNESNQPEDKGWTARSYGATSDTINTIYTQYLSVGDQNNSAHWDEVDTRQVSVPSAHDIATTGYSNYPSFIPNYEGDGDITFEKVMPNLVGMGSDQFVAALQAAGFSGSTGTVPVYAGSTTANNGIVVSQNPVAGAIVNATSQPALSRYSRPQVPLLHGLTEAAATTALTNLSLVKGTVTTSGNDGGATAENDGRVKDQSVAAGTYVNGGTTVNIIKYAYVAPVTPSTTGPIAGFNRAMGVFGSLNGDDAIMYLVGRTVRPGVNEVVSVSGTSDDTNFARKWLVREVINNDSYNTGGTAVKVTAVSGSVFVGVSASGGTWELPAALLGPTSNWTMQVVPLAEGHPFFGQKNTFTITLNDVAFTPTYMGSSAWNKGIIISGNSSVNGLFTTTGGANAGGQMQFEGYVDLGAASVGTWTGAANAGSGTAKFVS